MNRELLAKAIAHIESEYVVLGSRLIYNEETGLFCAIGEMARAAGIDVKHDDVGIYAEIDRAYNMVPAERNAIWDTNDRCGRVIDGVAIGGKKEVLRLLRSYLEEA